MNFIFSHPLCSISWLNSETPDEVNVLPPASFRLLLLDLKNNRWFQNDGLYPASNHRQDYMQISYSGRYAQTGSLSSGHLNDPLIFSLVQIINGTIKYAHQPKIILLQIHHFLFQLKSESDSRTSVIAYADALVIFNWVEELKSLNIVSHPQVSPSSMNRICKTFYGLSVAALKRKIILAETMNKILTSDNTLLNIGSAAGYRNRDNFITAFKKEFSLTPGALRLFYRRLVLFPS